MRSIFFFSEELARKQTALFNYLYCSCFKSLWHGFLDMVLFDSCSHFEAKNQANPITTTNTTEAQSRQGKTHFTPHSREYYGKKNYNFKKSSLFSVMLSLFVLSIYLPKLILEETLRYTWDEYYLPQRVHQHRVGHHIQQLHPRGLWHSL